ncbi:MAG TPA: pyridoxine 5'-phosphate synthase, partial [Pseudohongiella sp.]|nr:pyridoxine 5'-phosphate synthase [Pseudohongiella sp.]
MTLLSVNVNKIALLRNSRGTNYPDLLTFVRKILDAGVMGITVHPRPDERHVTRQDAHDIAELLKSRPDVEFNIEGYPSDGFMRLIETIRPAQCTLVPDEPGQLTSDHGWDVRASKNLLTEVLPALRKWGVRSSLFLDP